MPITESENDPVPRNSPSRALSVDADMGPVGCPSLLIIEGSKTVGEREKGVDGPDKRTVGAAAQGGQYNSRFAQRYEAPVA